MVSGFSGRHPGRQREYLAKCGGKDEEGEFVGYARGVGVEECALLCMYFVFFFFWFPCLMF